MLKKKEKDTIKVPSADDKSQYYKFYLDNA